MKKFYLISLIKNGFPLTYRKIVELNNQIDYSIANKGTKVFI